MRLRIGAMVLGSIGAIGGYTLGILALSMGVILKELGELFELEIEGLATISMAFLPINVDGSHRSNYKLGQTPRCWNFDASKRYLYVWPALS